MKKIGIIFKETSENRIRDSLKNSQGLFVVKYSGLSSPDLSTLRSSLRSSQAELFVVKNTVARRALKNSGLEPLLQSIEGPCGLIFVREEPANASKILFNFSKGHEQLKLEGGCIGEEIIEKNDIEAMAKLPGKDGLRALVVMTLNAPLSRLVRALNYSLSKLVICLEKIREKKS